MRGKYLYYFFIIFLSVASVHAQDNHKIAAAEYSEKKSDRQELDKLSLGLGYPYISLIWNFNRKFGIEPRFASDFDEIHIIGSRFNYKVRHDGPSSIYVGIEADYLLLSTEEDYYSSSGFMAGSYIGVIYNISRSLAFNMDMGPYYVVIAGEDYDVDVSGVDLMLSMGVQIK